MSDKQPQTQAQEPADKKTRDLAEKKRQWKEQRDGGTTPTGTRTIRTK